MNTPPPSPFGFHVLLFHAFYRQEDQGKHKHPLMFISVKEFERCIEILLEKGFECTDKEKLKTAREKNNLILLTFDDGYYNNIYTLEILEKYNIKATLFPVKSQIVNKKYFWWDVYYLNRCKSEPFSVVYNEIQKLKRFELPQIEEILKNEFGEDCFNVSDDLCRPLTKKELKELSLHPLIDIGVHSDSHEILTNCSLFKIKNEIQDGKIFLEDICGHDIDFISYPNGNYNDNIVSTADELGFKTGVTTIQGYNIFEDINTKKDWLTLKRNSFPVPFKKGSVIDHINDFCKQVQL